MVVIAPMHIHSTFFKTVKSKPGRFIKVYDKLLKGSTYSPLFSTSAVLS